jgi:hypothetical protein
MSADQLGGELEHIEPGHSQTPSGRAGGAQLWRRSEVGLVLVAVAFTAFQLAAVPLRLPLGFDEAVYSSQASGHAPAAFFGAPRARGISWLAAPAVALSSSTAVLRGWMLLLAAVGLVTAFWPWRRLVRGSVVVGAAAFLASLWVVQFYASEVMPNLYVAYGTVAASGWFLHAVTVPRCRRAALAALAASVAFTALVRPSDAVFVTFALLAAVLAMRAWRQIGAASAVLGGLAAGLLPWIVEAYAHFGGPLARLRQGSEDQGGMRWHLAVGMQLRALNGPLLCRPCEKPWSYPALSLWWFATPVLAGAGLLLAARTRRTVAARFPVLALPTACALAVSAQYLFLLDYAAPRFLIPAYALLALPVAAFAVGAAGAAPIRWRPTVAVLLAAVFGVHLAGQLMVLHRRAAEQTQARSALLQLAQRLTGAGLRPPCTLLGPDVVQMAYYAGCASQELTDSGTPAASAQLMRRAAAEGPGQVVPDYAHGWTRCSFTLSNGSLWHVYLAPSPGASWRC